jgi:hypothetical protein
VAPEPPVNKTPPTISGASSAQQGVELKEEHGSWNNSPTGYTYQWQRCESSGANCANISTAEAQGYTPIEADVAHTLRVLETASNASGKSKEAAASPVTAVVLPAAPVNTGAPKINGASTAQQGVELQEEHGSWSNNPTGFTYQWLQCNSVGASCLPISGASKQGYTPVEGDAGHTLKVEETASNAGGKSKEAAVSAATAVVLPAAPVNTTPPTIKGASSAQQGSELIEEHGSWRNNPTSFSYQWQQCNAEGKACANIVGAEAQTYAPNEGDVGHKLRVLESAANAGGKSKEAAASEPTEVVKPLPPVNEKPPTITGEPQQGQTLTEHNGMWSHNPTGYTYQWLRCEALGTGCEPITGATKQTYVLQAIDVGHAIRVQEVASNAGGSGVPAVSEPSAPVIPESGKPTPQNQPTITGEARQGKTLTEQSASWTHEPTSFAYQWLQCDSSGNSCKAIPGATKQEYVPVEGDIGHRLRVQEEATNLLGTSSPDVSEPTAIVVPPAPTLEKPPTINGASAAQQGKELKEVHGTWSNGPTGYSYQWQRCESTGANCANISGAEAQGYTPVEADVGHRLRALETASNAGGPSETPAATEVTAVVLPAVPVNVVPPRIAGASTAQQGKELKEEHGSWTNNPTGYSYQWQQCSSTGEGCTSIAGAESQAYVPAEADVGHRLRVLETASNAGGPSEKAASSEVTAVVAAPHPVPLNEAPPTLTGTALQGQPLTEAHGKWSNEPIIAYSYGWQRCNSAGEACVTISGAEAQSYVPGEADVGTRLRVLETATNIGGPSEAAASAPTAVVQGIFGKTNIGALKDTFNGGRKRVNRYALPAAGAVAKLTLYLEPTGKPGQQVMKGVIYADQGGSPTTLLGVTEQLTFQHTNTPGWYEMRFASPVKVAAGSYWIGELTGSTANVAGFRYDSVPGSRDFNSNVYSAGPSNPFGTFNTDAEQTSLYATYTPG